MVICQFGLLTQGVKTVNALKYSRKNPASVVSKASACCEAWAPIKKSGATRWRGPWLRACSRKRRAAYMAEAMSIGSWSSWQSARKSRRSWAVVK